MEHTARDLRFALRSLFRRPAVTALALVSLAVGIGACVTVFTLANALLLRGLPVADPETLVSLFTTEESDEPRPGGALLPMSRLNYEDYRAHNEVFTDLALGSFLGATLTAADGVPERLGGQIVTSNYFDLLGVYAAVGRTFLAAEDAAPGAPRVVVLSHSFWSERFGADPDVVGSEITLNSQLFTVVGVAPRGFTGTFTVFDLQFWAPLSTAEVFFTGRRRRAFDSRRVLLFRICFGRLEPGVTLEQAQASMELLARSLEAQHPDDNRGRNVALVPLNQAAIPERQRPAFVRAGKVLATIVVVGMLIACANVMNLLVGQALDRRREIAMRLSLGASRWRLVRQLVTESLALALAAGGLGLLVAYLGRRLLLTLEAHFFDLTALDLGFDGRVLTFTMGLTLLTAVLIGLLPALLATRQDLIHTLKDAAGAVGASRGSMRLSSLSVLGQVGLCLLILMASGLFFRSLDELERADLGFDAGRLIAMAFDVGSRGYSPDRGEQFFGELEARASSLPGVLSASVASSVPFATVARPRGVVAQGQEAENTRHSAVATAVGVDYFQTTGIELLEGRGLDASDRAETRPVAVVNRALAGSLWPGDAALGRRFAFSREPDRWLEVVGVAEDSVSGNVGEASQAVAYLPRSQNYRPMMGLLVRTAGDPGALTETVRRALQPLDPEMPITNVTTMARAVARAHWIPHTIAKLLGVFAVVALTLAAIGLYGVTSQAVMRRRREIGLRMALGARRGQLLTMVLHRGMLLVAGGTVLGLLTAAVLTRLYRSELGELLYGVSLYDLRSLVLACLAMALVTFAANLIPALRATRVNPIDVLRNE